ncbi:hypothetical protein GH714_008938 [Hevea brasiliensis]|uniref:Uncharacterized protein n=1 Tax=Hevea brasiliensis TaxID=3981 RepID=A0A6A6N273_HEVBR|nr:hypothetical protein GH714_008938 [Hevea brasiliensis]
MQGLASEMQPKEVLGKMLVMSRDLDLNSLSKPQWLFPLSETPESTTGNTGGGVRRFCLSLKSLSSIFVGILASPIITLCFLELADEQREVPLLEECLENELEVLILFLLSNEGEEDDEVIDDGRDFVSEVENSKKSSWFEGEPGISFLGSISMSQRSERSQKERASSNSSMVFSICVSKR